MQNFDTNFNFRSHVSAVCRSCRYHIIDLRRIRCYLTFGSAKLLAHSLVSSGLDYCNSLLFDIADKEIIQFEVQRVQNSFPRVVTEEPTTSRLLVVTKKPPLTCSDPLLRSLHWLPIQFRVEFKACVLTYKTSVKNTEPRSLKRYVNPINFTLFTKVK